MYVEEDFSPFYIKESFNLSWYKSRFQIPTIYRNAQQKLRIRNYYQKSLTARSVRVAPTKKLKEQFRSESTGRYIWPKSENAPIARVDLHKYVAYKNKIYELAHKWPTVGIHSETRNTLVYRNKFLIPLGHDPSTALSRILADSFRRTNLVCQPNTSGGVHCLCGKLGMYCIHTKLVICQY